MEIILTERGKISKQRRSFNPGSHAERGNQVWEPGSLERFNAFKLAFGQYTPSQAIQQALQGFSNNVIFFFNFSFIKFLCIIY
jgi:hypothetical protein